MGGRGGGIRGMGQEMGEGEGERKRLFIYSVCVPAAEMSIEHRVIVYGLVN